jgi:hypothetical protein
VLFRSITPSCSFDLGKTLKNTFFSVRIIMNVTSLNSTSIILSSDAPTPVGQIRMVTLSGGIIDLNGDSNGVYKNGVFISTQNVPVILNQYFEYVFIVRSAYVGFPRYLFGSLSSVFLTNASVKLVEIYNVQLSAAEISNLYNNKTNEPFYDKSEVFHLNAYKGIITDKFNNTIVNTNVGLIRSNGNNFINYNSTASASYTQIPDVINILPFTLTTWYNAYQAQPFAASNKLLSRLNTAQYWLSFQNTTFPQNAYFYLPGGTQFQFNTTLPVYNKLTFITIQRDNTGQYFVSYNGAIPIALTLVSGDLETPITSTNLFIGGTKSLMKILNMRIFNRVLTANEVSQIYTSEKKLFNL